MSHLDIHAAVHLEISMMVPRRCFQDAGGVRGRHIMIAPLLFRQVTQAGQWTDVAVLEKTPSLISSFLPGWSFTARQPFQPGDILGLEDENLARDRRLRQ